jgi:hypothetical protein
MDVHVRVWPRECPDQVCSAKVTYRNASGTPTQLSPAYDSADHLHVNDAGNFAQGNAIPLALFRVR